MGYSWEAIEWAAKSDIAHNLGILLSELVLPTDLRLVHRIIHRLPPEQGIIQLYYARWNTVAMPALTISVCAGPSFQESIGPSGREYRTDRETCRVGRRV